MKSKYGLRYFAQDFAKSGVGTAGETWDRWDPVGIQWKLPECEEFLYILGCCPVDFQNLEVSRYNLDRPMEILGTLGNPLDTNQVDYLQSGISMK